MRGWPWPLASCRGPGLLAGHHRRVSPFYPNIKVWPFSLLLCCCQISVNFWSHVKCENIRAETLVPGPLLYDDQDQCQARRWEELLATWPPGTPGPGPGGRAPASQVHQPSALGTRQSAAARHSALPAPSVAAFVSPIIIGLINYQAELAEYWVCS